MVQIFHQDQNLKMYFLIPYNNDFHHTEIFEPSQTQLILLIRFMSLSWRHGPQKKLLMKYFLNEETRNRNFLKS